MGGSYAVWHDGAGGFKSSRSLPALASAAEASAPAGVAFCFVWARGVLENSCSKLPVIGLQQIGHSEARSRANSLSCVASPT